MNKSELLQKGISPAVADEILASFNDAGKSDSPLLALSKALKGSDEAENDLFKAEDHKEPDDDNKGGKSDDDDDNEGDYDSEYMKKYMKKYMKENKEDCKKAADEAGLNEEKLNKAISQLDLSGEGAVVEMEDLSGYLRASTDFNKSMLKAMNLMASEIQTIKAQHAESYSLMHKAATVQAITAQALGQSLGQSAGRKGVTAAAPMQKAAEVRTDATLIYQTLAKAMNSGDQKAGFILSAFESSGKKMTSLDNTQKAYISELLNKGE